ncbi:TetR/AcrR family transcriptional regulator [Pantoea agglomerans]|uniref:TetR/AcrR family transcriptional regulator n=1 Tax=Enterobacter agglomerans TaxID=549 RepID=UPI00077FF354|nr:TetR/AcrR family transcriptional regulator [Pantoea agglomerans]KYM71521.1 TetR family transcriptional regulator [Pantoea agglomerans]MCL6411590.1 TetR/AcrR family transcriptional regulator [Pantoea agglomerans]
MGRHREFDAEVALEAALVVFWKNGYEGTSFDDLTRATGVARPSLYATFGNKENLFRKALERYEVRYMAFMTGALQEPNVHDAVRLILNGMLDTHTLGGECRGCLGINGALACSEGAETIRQELITRRIGSETALLERLKRAKHEGELSSSADCEMLAKYLMTVAQGMAVQAKAGVTREKLQPMVDYVVSGWSR